MKEPLRVKYYSERHPFYPSGWFSLKVMHVNKFGQKDHDTYYGSNSKKEGSGFICSKCNTRKFTKQYPKGACRTCSNELSTTQPRTADRRS